MILFKMRVSWIYNHNDFEATCSNLNNTFCSGMDLFILHFVRIDGLFAIKEHINNLKGRTMAKDDNISYTQMIE